VIHSSDRGLNWKIQWQHKPKVFNGFYSFGVKFFNATEGLVIGKDGLLYTNDGGQHWEYRNTPPPKENWYWGTWIAEFKFVGQQHLQVRLRNEEVHESSDKGKTWKYLGKIHCINGKTYH